MATTYMTREDGLPLRQFNPADDTSAQRAERRALRSLLCGCDADDCIRELTAREETGDEFGADVIRCYMEEEGYGF